MSSAIHNIGEAFHYALRQLDEVDATAICCHVLNIDRLGLYRSSNQFISAEKIKQVRTLIDRRLKGEPIAYLFKKRYFYELEFDLNLETLIPRPDTETLVEEAQTYLTSRSHLLDMGTGCGAIGIALAHKTGCQLTLSDVSPHALKVAAFNLEKHNVQAKLVCSDWYDKIPPEKNFDVIVCNPPYIPTNDPHLRQQELGYEPLLALNGGKSGLDHLHVVIQSAPNYLKANGWLLVEHGYDQAHAVEALFGQAGFSEVVLVRDLNNHPRVTKGLCL